MPALYFQESRLQELCEGLVEESDEDVREEASEEQKTVPLPRRERKTERQRKKEKEAKVLVRNFRCSVVRKTADFHSVLLGGNVFLHSISS